MNNVRKRDCNGPAVTRKTGLTLFSRSRGFCCLATVGFLALTMSHFSIFSQMTESTPNDEALLVNPFNNQSVDFSPVFGILNNMADDSFSGLAKEISKVIEMAAVYTEKECRASNDFAHCMFILSTVREIFESIREFPPNSNKSITQNQLPNEKSMHYNHSVSHHGIAVDVPGKK